MKFEINYVIKPCALLCPNLKDVKRMLTSYSGEKIVPCCACLCLLCSAGFRRSETEELCFTQCLAKGPTGTFSPFPCTKLLNLAWQIQGACNPADGSWVHLSVKGSGWLQRNSGVQLLPSRPEPAVLWQGVQSEFSILSCTLIVSCAGSTHALTHRHFHSLPSLCSDCKACPCLRAD